MPFIFESIVVKHKSVSCLLLLLHVPPSHKKSYITLALVHLIYMAGGNYMRQNARY